MEIAKSNLIQELKVKHNDFLIIQDMDGVCMQLVNDPLTRLLSPDYVYAADNLGDRLKVLTNGEFEGARGLNKLVEKAMNSNLISSKAKEIYLSGLAAGGVQRQNIKGIIDLPGIKQSEIVFLQSRPSEMQSMLRTKLKKLFVKLTDEKLDELTSKSILDTELSPTINLNNLFAFINWDLDVMRKLQLVIEDVMECQLQSAKNSGLDNSFFLHKAPNLGVNNGKEVIKYADQNDIGTTDIQFMLKGAIKEAGLLVLINDHIEQKHGYHPLGNEFNARNAPSTQKEMVRLCIEEIKPEHMPLLIGVGDTITSTFCTNKNMWLRGGSDRGFLTLIQELGRQYKKENQVLVVDSSGGEVNRPSFNNKELKGITDADDTLKFNLLFPGGPDEYIRWFCNLSRAINQR